MSSISKLIAMALAILLSGCISLVERRDKSFNILGDQPLTGTLMIIGGNSECSADKGLWAIREDIASRIAASLGIERKALSTIYFAWTGEEPGKGSCLPGFDYLDGEDKIYNQIAQKGLLSSKKLIVVGYSNGGATAADLSRLIKKNTADHRKVDLLITLDPVSRLTGGYRPSDAETWLNVYTRSKNSRTTTSCRRCAKRLAAAPASAGNGTVSPSKCCIRARRTMKRPPNRMP